MAMWFRPTATAGLFPFQNGGDLDTCRVAAVAFFGGYMLQLPTGEWANLLGQVVIGEIEIIPNSNPDLPPHVRFTVEVDRVTVRSFLAGEKTEGQLHDEDADTRRRCYGQFPEDYCAPVPPDDDGLPHCEEFRKLGRFQYGLHWASRFSWEAYAPSTVGGWVIENQFQTAQMGYLHNDYPESPCQTSFTVLGFGTGIGPFWPEQVGGQTYIYGPFGPIVAGLSDDPFPDAPIPEPPPPTVSIAVRTVLQSGRFSLQVTLADDGTILDPDIYYQRWVSRVVVRDVIAAQTDLIVWDDAYTLPNDPDHHLVNVGRIRLSTIMSRPNPAFPNGTERRQVDSPWYYTTLPQIVLPVDPPLPLTPDLQIEDKTQIERTKFQRYGMQVWTAIIQPAYRFIIAKPEGPEPVEVVVWHVQIRITTWGVTTNEELFLSPSDLGFAQTRDIALTGATVRVRVRAQDILGRFGPWGSAFQYIGWAGEPLNADDGTPFEDDIV